MSLKKLLAATAVAGALASAPAQAFLQNWYIDADGAGVGVKDQISEFLDLVGPSYVGTTPAVGGLFGFSEVGAVVSDRHDGVVSYANTNKQLAAVFNLTGGGDLTNGTVLYTGGTISVYSNPPGSFGTAAGTLGADVGTLIGTFSPVSGGGFILPSGIPNGVQTISAAATFLAPGYWFAPDGTTDLSTLLGPDPTIFGFATTNASRVDNAADIVIDELAPVGYTNPGVLPAEGIAGSFIISNNGQFRLIPEPGSLALLGLALLGMAGFTRRKPQA